MNVQRAREIFLIIECKYQKFKTIRLANSSSKIKYLIETEVHKVLKAG